MEQVKTSHDLGQRVLAMLTSSQGPLACWPNKWIRHEVKGKPSTRPVFIPGLFTHAEAVGKGPALFSLTQNWGEGLQLECLCVFVFTGCVNEVKTKNLNFQTSPSPPPLPGVAGRGAESFITHLLRFHSKSLPFPSALMYSVCLGHCLFCHSYSCRQSVFAHQGIMLSYLFLCIFNMWGLCLQRVSSWRALSYRWLKWKLWVAAFHPFDSLLLLLVLLLGNEPEGF